MEELKVSEKEKEKKEKIAKSENLRNYGDIVAEKNKKKMMKKV